MFLELTKLNGYKFIADASTVLFDQIGDKVYVYVTDNYLVEVAESYDQIKSVLNPKVIK